MFAAPRKITSMIACCALTFGSMANTADACWLTDWLYGRTSATVTTAPPTIYNGYAAPQTVQYAPANYGVQRVVYRSSVPAPGYRSEYYRIPTTVYRPTTVYQSGAVAPAVAYQGCTTSQYGVQRIPSVVYGSSGCGCGPTAYNCAPSTVAPSTVSPYAQPPAAGWQPQQPAATNPPTGNFGMPAQNFQSGQTVPSSPSDAASQTPTLPREYTQPPTSAGGRFSVPGNGAATQPQQPAAGNGGSQYSIPDNSGAAGGATGGGASGMSRFQRIPYNEPAQPAAQPSQPSADTSGEMQLNGAANTSDMSQAAPQYRPMVPVPVTTQRPAAVPSNNTSSPVTKPSWNLAPITPIPDPEVSTGTNRNEAPRLLDPRDRTVQSTTPTSYVVPVAWEMPEQPEVMKTRRMPTLSVPAPQTAPVDSNSLWYSVEK